MFTRRIFDPCGAIDLLCTSSIASPDHGSILGASPCVHDSDATRPLLLATRFAMEQDFYLGYLRERHGIQAVVPEEQDRMEVHRVIYEELCQGKVINSSKQTYMQIIDKARSDADLPADSVIFGCTEIGLLITPDDFSFPAFDTTVLHAEAALTFAGY